MPSLAMRTARHIEKTPFEIINNVLMVIIDPLAEAVSYDGSTPSLSIALAENRAVVESCYKSIPPTTFFSILTIYSKLTLPGVGSTPAAGISPTP